MKWLACLLPVLALSCRDPKNDADLLQVNQWYNAVNKNRYTDNDSLRYYTARLEERARHLPPPYQAMSFISKGLYYSRTASYRASLGQFQQALPLAAGTDSLVAKSYTGIGNAYKNMGDYPNAIEHFQKALQVYEKMGHREGMAGIHSNLGQVYQMRENMPQAKQHVRQALAILSNNKRSVAYLTAAHTLANLYGMEGALDSTLLVDEEGLRLAGEMGLAHLKSPFLDNKANTFMYGNKPDSARIYFYQALAIDSASGNDKQVADTYLNLGMLAFRSGEPRAAEDYYRKALSLSQRSKYRQGERGAWTYLVELYTNENEFKKAFDAQTGLAAVKDSIVNEKTEGRIAELETLYETGKKEQQIAGQSLQLSRQRTAIIAVAAGALVLLFAGYAYYQRYRSRREREWGAILNKQKGEATMQVLTAEEKERQRIASDLHDGIGQMMTAAWLNLQALGSRGSTGEEASLIEKTTKLVGESCTEIRQVSHNMMPNALTRKGLVNSLREFTNQLDAGRLLVNFQADKEKLELDQTTELILYRVIQECVNNAVKHANATELDISISSAADGLDILVEDNGKGFDVAAMQEAPGIGLQNIRSRIHYLGGTVEWDNTGSGTVVAIHIPPVS